MGTTSITRGRFSSSCTFAQSRRHADLGHPRGQPDCRSHQLEHGDSLLSCRTRVAREFMSKALCLCLALGSLATASAQEVTVTGRVDLGGDVARGKTPNAANVVVWLTPLAGSASLGETPAQFPGPHLRLLQKNKSFDPHVLVVAQGAVVEFPNADPFFHNVFSLFEGKRFDLGLYEAGSTRTLRLPPVTCQSCWRRWPQARPTPTCIPWHTLEARFAGRSK